MDSIVQIPCINRTDTLSTIKRATVFWSSIIAEYPPSCFGKLCNLLQGGANNINIVMCIVEEQKTNLMSLANLFHFLCAQHVSDINISIIRSLRLFC